MYKPTDVEILEAFDDYLENMPDTDDSISGSAIWLEAWKRGMRFNPNASQPVVETDAKCSADFHKEEYLNGSTFCRVCGKRIR